MRPNPAWGKNCNPPHDHTKVCLTCFLPPVCADCGNDEAAEGLEFCLDCAELAAPARRDPS